MQLILSINFFLIAGLVGAQQSSLPAETPIDKEALATLKIDDYPDFLASDEEGVWVTNDGRVEKFTFGTTNPVMSVSMPAPCGAMVTGFGSLWAASCEKKTIHRIDLLSGEISAIIETGLADSEGELSMAIGAGSVWLLTNADGQLSRIDPYQNKVIRKIKVAPHSFAVAFGFGSIWVTNTQDGSLQRIDPIKEKVIATIRVGPSPRFLTIGCGSIWTLNQGDGTVSRIDPETTKVVSTITAEVVGTGGDIAAGAAKIYVRAKNTLLSIIDPAINKVVARYGPPAGSGAVRVENGRVWVTAHDINTIWILKD
jgi:YVTN family beta-propeller protein